MTGGSRGIGEAISKALKAEGYNVAATYAGNDEKAAAFTDATGIKTYKWNVADYEASKAGIAKVEEELGPIDIVVANAGITRDAVLHRMTKEQWNEVIRTDLDSVFNMCRQVIEGMRKRGYGRIINVASINGRKGQMGQTNYSAAKAGIHGFTKALAFEGAAKGITVNTIAPGYVATEMVRAVPKEVLDTKIIPQIPVGRLGEAEEIARAVTFLAAEDAGFVTGACLDINGGHYMAT